MPIMVFDKITTINSISDGSPKNAIRINMMNPSKLKKVNMFPAKICR